MCPSCGGPKGDAEGKAVCFPCYHRGTVGTVKMLCLMVLHENGKYMTASEIVEAMNNHPANNGKRIFNEKTIKQLLWRLKGKNYKIVLAKKAKSNGRG